MRDETFFFCAYRLIGLKIWLGVRRFGMKNLDIKTSTYQQCRLLIYHKTNQIYTYMGNKKNKKPIRGAS